MKNNKRWKKLLAGAVSMCLTISSIYVPAVMAEEGSTQTEETYTDQAAEDPAVTPAEALHSDYYAEPAETDSISGWPVGPSIEGQAAVLLEMNTNTVLYAKNPDLVLYPASITKILTALVACENLDAADSLTVSYEAAYGIEAGSSSIYADTGEVFTVEQALMALMLESANEMALALAEASSGSVKKFVEQMNERVHQIGCTNTHFNNPNGLPDETHFTTAADMAQIARTAWLNPNFRKYVTTNYYEIPPTNVQSETRYLSNHHKMMAGKERAYDGVLGGKTGYTLAAGNTLVTYAKRGNLLLVAVVLKSTTEVYTDTASLLDFGFANFENARVSVDSAPVTYRALPGDTSVLDGDGTFIPYSYSGNVYVTVPVGTDLSGLTTTMETGHLPGGTGYITNIYLYNDHQVGSGTMYQNPNALDAFRTQ